MKKFEDMKYDPDQERLVQIIMRKTKNSSPLFFRIQTAYYLACCASMMRATVESPTIKNPLPVNMYSFALTTSGAGKGYACGLMEDQVINQFKSNYLMSTLPIIAERNLPRLANRRAAMDPSADPDRVLESVKGEYSSIEMAWDYDSGSSPAVKHLRHKLLMAQSGALNLQVDEIGTNLSAIAETLAPYLEMFDRGKTKSRLIKGGADNKRLGEVIGEVPANYIGFGTPSRLLDGGKTEEDFWELCSTGFARRCFFAFIERHIRPKFNGDMADRVNAAYKEMTDDTSDQFLFDLSNRIGLLADPINHDKVLVMDEAVDKLFIEYQFMNEDRAEGMLPHEEIRIAEMSHRHFKARKLAAVYAFIAGNNDVTMANAEAAIKIAEEAGDSFQLLLERPAPYMRVANYLADMKRRCSHHDLQQDLPFFKGKAHKEELISLATAYGYDNQIVIKKIIENSIEFLQADTLEPTDLSSMTLSHSGDIAKGYMLERPAFDQLHILTQQSDPVRHWANHAFSGGHRCEEQAMPGFDMIVLDVDDGVPLSTAKMLLGDYKALYHTTASHQKEKNGIICDRFRIIMPMNYRLEMDAETYKTFMQNIFEWLPFKVDEQTKQRARKWLSAPGQYEYTDGILLDVVPFIPQTTKAQAMHDRVVDQKGMDNLERWVMNNSGKGNRNEMLLRYATILVDAGWDYEQVHARIVALNSKMADSLDEAEILATIMVTVNKKISQRSIAA